MHLGLDVLKCLNAKKFFARSGLDHERLDPGHSHFLHCRASLGLKLNKFWLNSFNLEYFHLIKLQSQFLTFFITHSQMIWRNENVSAVNCYAVKTDHAVRFSLPCENGKADQAEIWWVSTLDILVSSIVQKIMAQADFIYVWNKGKIVSIHPVCVVNWDYIFLAVFKKPWNDKMTKIRAS